jgi:hypothetical protein
MGNSHFESRIQDLGFRNRAPVALPQTILDLGP